MESASNDTSFPAVPLMPRLELPTHPSWLQAARMGETWALEQLYQRCRPAVFSLCWKLLGNADDAEDAMQATFVCAFRGLPRFRGESAIATWIYRIAVNEATAILRKRRKQPVSLEIEVAPNEASATAEDLAVRVALTRVKLEHRVVLVLRFWEDLDYLEIAETLGISLSAARMRLKRAKAEFRKYYEEDW